MAKSEFEHQSTVNMVLAGMRRDILLGKYKDRKGISEAEIAGKYHVSRSSVRVVCRTLISDGLMIEKRNGRKEIVTVTEKYIEDLCQTRSVLECAACRIILERKNNDFLKLLSIVGEFYSGLQIEDGEKRRYALADANDRFHEEIFQMTENITLIQCMHTIWPMISTIVFFNASLAPDMNEHDNYESHKKITDMLMEKDPDVLEFVRYHSEEAAIKDVLRAIDQAREKLGDNDVVEDNGEIFGY